MAGETREDALRARFSPAGKILTDDFADKEGLEMGDEYFANLDHIESVENSKEGYESEAKCSSDSSGVNLKDEEDDNSGTEEAEESNEESSDDNFCKDEDFSTSSVWRSYATRRQTRGQRENGLSETASKDSGPARQASHEEAPPSCKPPVSEETSKNKVASWLSSNTVADGYQDSDSRSSFRMQEAAEVKPPVKGEPGEGQKSGTPGLLPSKEEPGPEAEMKAVKKKEVRSLGRRVAGGVGGSPEDPSRSTEAGYRIPVLLTESWGEDRERKNTHLA